MEDKDEIKVFNVPKINNDVFYAKQGSLQIFNFFSWARNSFLKFIFQRLTYVPY